MAEVATDVVTEPTVGAEVTRMDVETAQHSLHEQQQQQRQQQQQQQAAVPPPHPAAPPGRTYEPAPSRSKKGRGKRSNSEPPDLVHLVGPIPKDSERMQQGWRPVRLSEEEKAGEITLDEFRLQAESQKGYRMVRATQGSSEGTWYYEVHIVQLGNTGAARIGWSTARGELQAPVGYDIWSYAYRSKEGSKVHAGWRDEYGEPYAVGDVIGCLIHLPPGGQPLPTLRERASADAVKLKGKAYLVETEDEEKEPEPDAKPLPGSFVAFTRNGKLQGKAYTNIREGTYYPAISLYTNSSVFDKAVVCCNFGDSPFAHPPPQIEGCPQPQSVSQMVGPKPES